VLTSFPIKQSEFLMELAKENKIGLLRYFAVTGLAAYSLERFLDTEVGALGGAEVAGAEIPIPGTEFLTSIARGVPSPAIQLAADGQDMLSEFSSGNRVMGVRAAGRFLDTLTNVIPASVAVKEVARGLTNIFEVDPVTGEQGVVRTRIGVVPFVKEVTPLGSRVTATDATLEVRKLFGVPSAKQAAEAALARQVASRVRGLNSDRARAFDLTGHALRTGRQLTPEQGEQLRALGGTMTGLTSSMMSAENDPLLNTWLSASEDIRKILIAEFPELIPTLQDLGRRRRANLPVQ
jgi:hypothetical protein